MIQDEFSNPYFDSQLIDASLSTKTYFVHVGCWCGTKKHPHLMKFQHLSHPRACGTLQGFTLDELKEAKCLGFTEDTTCHDDRIFLKVSWVLGELKRIQNSQRKIVYARIAEESEWMTQLKTSVQFCGVEGGKCKISSSKNQHQMLKWPINP